MSQLTKEVIVNAIVKALEKLEYVQALWEMGAISFNRVDEWSDIDFLAIVDDDKVDETWEVAEKTLKSLSEIEVRHKVPEPGFKNISHCFYKLKHTNPYLMVDIALIRESNEYKFLQQKIHGKPFVHFDKKGMVKDAGFDEQEQLAKIAERKQELKRYFTLFHPFIEKEIKRGNYIEAISHHYTINLRILIEALRMRHCFERYDFHFRYVHYDLPEIVVMRLAKLHFVSGPKDLLEKSKEAEQWFWEIIEETVE